MREFWNVRSADFLPTRCQKFERLERSFAARVKARPPRSMDSRTGPPAAPTLVKYTAPLPYLERARYALAEAATEILDGIPLEPYAVRVQLTTEQPFLEEMVATLLYEHDSVGRSYQQISACVADLSESRKTEILNLSVSSRGQHDELMRAHQAGQALKFDVLMDFGSFRDLHRHRRCVQIIQGPRVEHGFDDPVDVFRLGLGEAGAEATEIQGRYRQALLDAASTASWIQGENGNSAQLAQYSLPLAARTRALFKMEIAEAAYIIEQRTQPAGHFSYRHVAWEMYEELRRALPSIASIVRAVDPHEVVDLFRR